MKQDDPMGESTDRYEVDPCSGDVFDPEGEIIGNLQTGW
jgi:hypothetical protein